MASCLTEGRDNGPAFYVVAPSLPNFDISGATKKRGPAIEQYAETWHKLMVRLRYEQYATQGDKHGSPNLLNDMLNSQQATRLGM